MDFEVGFPWILRLDSHDLRLDSHDSTQKGARFFGEGTAAGIDQHGFRPSGGPEKCADLARPSRQ